MLYKFTHYNNVDSIVTNIYDTFIFCNVNIKLYRFTIFA